MKFPLTVRADPGELLKLWSYDHRNANNVIDPPKAMFDSKNHTGRCESHIADTHTNAHFRAPKEASSEW